jgi:hypothetical protein
MAEILTDVFYQRSGTLSGCAPYIISKKAPVSNPMQLSGYQL